jgi:hypothetical protein
MELTNKCGSNTVVSVLSLIHKTRLKLRDTFANIFPPNVQITSASKGHVLDFQPVSTNRKAADYITIQ